MKCKRLALGCKAFGHSFHIVGGSVLFGTDVWACCHCGRRR